MKSFIGIKKRYLSFYCIILTLFCQVFLCSGAHAGVQDFYFDSFEADYYLEKTEEGTSTLRVVERLAAVFPNFDQNKGICRRIPYKNKGGQNVTLTGLSRSDITLKRNGVKEPIYSIEKEGGYYEVCTGTDDYIRGRQVFTLEYTFKNVITEFSEDGKDWQELYWNTNGTGWSQRFNSLTARVHLPADMTPKETSCYVGSQEEKGAERCQTVKTEDGYTFSTGKLLAGENLTFDIEIEADAFVVPAPEKSYFMVIVLIIVIVFALLLTLKLVKNYQKYSEKREFYKHYFVKPEYAPHEKYGLLEMAENYIGTYKDTKVALLLKMIVEKRIELVKGEKKLLGGNKYKIRVVTMGNILPEEKTILKILNGGKEPISGEEIELKRRTANSTLVSLGNTYSSYGRNYAKTHGLLESKAIAMGNIGNLFTTTMIIIICMFTLVPALTTFVFGTVLMALSETNVFSDSGKVLVFGGPAILIIMVIVVVMIAASLIVSGKNAKYKNHTMLGLEMSRYMDGLKLYIKMAEADRIKFLQSVDGADTSDGGIVKLYEKLLPYAALFGLEKTWLKELDKYYQCDDVTTPTWYSNIGSVSAISTFASTLSHTSSIISSSSSYSGGSSSSGGGGGGFSGGGGGGGGGGGR